MAAEPRPRALRLWLPRIELEAELHLGSATGPAAAVEGNAVRVMMPK